MPAQTSQPVRMRSVVSVTAMARAVGLSRSRFYDYINRSVFPQPLYSIATRRPFYTAEMQQDILNARQSGIGCNGEYVIFYERSAVSTAPARRGSAPRTAPTDFVARLAEVGLTVTPEQVQQALATCFPTGTAGQDEALVLRTLNRHLRRPIAVR